MAYIPHPQQSLFAHVQAINAAAEKPIPRYACLRARLTLAVVDRSDQLGDDIRKAIVALAEIDEKEAGNGQRV